MKQEPVKSWMSTDVITVSPETTLPEAHRLMKENHIRRLPVVKGGKLVGIVTRADVRGAEANPATTLSVWELNYLLAKLTIGEIMTRDPITIAPDDTISRAVTVMSENKISALLVVEAEKLVGIITESDIFRLVAQTWKE